MIMFFYLIYCNFDATYLFEYTYIMLYNLLFTSLPVIVMGIFEQDINSKASLAFPQLYKRGIEGLEYTRTKFWLYILDGCYQAVVCFWMAYGAYINGATQSYSGRDASSLWEIGVTISCTCVICANGYVGLNSKYWTWIVWTVNVVTTILVFIWTTIYSAFKGQNFYGEVIKLFSSATFWFTVILTPFIALAPRFIIKLVHLTYWPMDKDIIRERWIVGDLKDELGLKHRSEIESEKKERRRQMKYEEDLEMNVHHVHSPSDYNDNINNNIINGHDSIASFADKSISSSIRHTTLPKLNTSVNVNENNEDDPYYNQLSPTYYNDINNNYQLRLPPNARSQSSPRSVTSSRTTPYNVSAGTVTDLNVNATPYDDYPPTSPVRFSSNNPFNESREPLM